MSKNGLAASFRFAVRGILWVLRTQRNMRIHLVVAVMVLVAAAFLSIRGVELAALLIVTGMVLVCELFNSSLEKALDLLHPARHPMAAMVKDAAAGAVFLAVLLAVVVGLVIFIPHLIDFLAG